MSLRTWLRGRGSEPLVSIDGKAYTDIDCVAPYEATVLDQVFGQNGVATHHIATFDAATGLDKVRLLVPVEDFEKSTEILRQFRQRG